VPGPYAAEACQDPEDSDAWMEVEASRIEARMSEQERGVCDFIAERFQAPARCSSP